METQPQLPRLDLPSGGWVEFRDHNEATGREYRTLRSLVNTRNGNFSLDDLKHAFAQMFISAWELPGRRPALPSTPEGAEALENLHYADLDAIYEHVSLAAQGLANPDPKAKKPSKLPSGDSKPSSPDAAAPTE